jgi:hypothetical protein
VVQASFKPITVYSQLMRRGLIAVSTMFQGVSVQRRACASATSCVAVAGHDCKAIASAAAPLRAGQA